MPKTGFMLLFLLGKYLGMELLGFSLAAQTVKNLPANAGDASSIPGSGRSPVGGNGNPLQDFPWKIP